SANAVRCQWTASVPTPFLAIIGMPSVSIAARSTAAGSCPSLPPPGQPPAPFAIPLCSFNNNGNNGCGALISVDLNDWVALGGAANDSDIKSRLDYAYDPTTGTAPTIPPAGGSAPTNNGTLSNVFNALANYSPGGGGSWSGYFVNKYLASTSTPYTVRDANQNVVYTGPGWSLYGAVANTACSG